MRVITITGHDPGDYLHPEQKLEILDEATGTRYELYLRSNAMAATEKGEVSLFIPTADIREIQTDTAYCVVTLSAVASPREAEQRRARFAGTCLGGRPPRAQRLVAKRRTR